jgi:DNA-binding transcriptional MerR regulator
MSMGFTQQNTLPLPPAPEFVRPQRLATDTKSRDAFRTISEVATDLGVQQHVLRFWESKFQQIKPMKRGGGRRYYRPEDINLISSIKDLLYNQGFTIRGVQKLLRENGRNLGTLSAGTGSARSMVPDPQIPAGMAVAASAPSSSTTVSVVRQNVNAATSPAQPPAARVNALSPEKRRAIEGVLTELKTLRAMLSDGGF